MSTVNITVESRLHENGYRYKRSVIEVEHSHFKGATTRISNIEIISKQLQITPDDLEKGIVKYTKKRLGISTCGQLTFPGHVAAATLDSILQYMVERFVLCPKCKLPEWNRNQCRACGYYKNAQEEETKDEVKEKEKVDESKWKLELSQHMHHLYRERLAPNIPKDKVKEIDKLLDLAWTIETEHSYKNFVHSLKRFLSKQ